MRALEADVAFLNVAGGSPRASPPPGVLARPAPRRCARGRSEDLFLVCLSLNTTGPARVGFLDQLAQVAADTFFGTAGSVTSALRTAAEGVNDNILKYNSADPGAQLQGSMMTAVLRDQDVYFAQSGMAQAVVIRPGQATRLTSEEASERPLGFASVPAVRFHHLEVRGSDLIIVHAGSSAFWSDATLTGLAGLSLEQALDRLTASTAHDCSAILIRLVPPGLGTFVAAGETRAASRTTARPQAAGRRGRSERPAVSRTRGLPIRQWFAPLFETLRKSADTGMEAAGRLLSRLAPGLVESPSPGAFPRSLLAATAIIVPLIVVAVTSVVYLRSGRSDQYQVYLNEAKAAVAVAQLKGYTVEAMGDWQFAQQWLDLAEDYGQSTELDVLQQQVRGALDSINLVIRLDFRPVLTGGFGSNAEITAMAATAADLFILDRRNQIIWHAWFTGRGYELDREFQCLNGPGSVEGMGAPVDLVIQMEPGALGKEGMVAVDGDGTLLYCASEAVPVTGQLTVPNTGWRQIQAIDVFGETLYVLDSEANAVWIYDATEGLFSGDPAFYFAEDVLDLGTAIDVAMAEEELLVLHKDGRLNRCRRFLEGSPDGSSRVRVECEREPEFQDERPGHQSRGHISGAVPLDMTYTPPPEPSVFFLDSLSGGVYHYSLRLVYQGLYLPLQSYEGQVTALAMGPPNDLFVAAGGQVYRAELVR